MNFFGTFNILCSMTHLADSDGFSFNILFYVDCYSILVNEQSYNLSTEFIVLSAKSIAD